MKGYETSKIRNISLLGHRGSGKTTLIESILFISGIIPKQGTIEEGNTYSDFDKEEVRRLFSINTSVIPIEYDNCKYNFFDTPGYFDFVGEVHSALRVSGGAILVLDATSGVEVGTEKSWRLLEEKKLPRIIFINKMDKGYVNYEKLLLELKEKFGKKIAPFCIPIGEKEEFKGFIDVVNNKSRIYNGKECVDGPLPPDIDITEVKNLLIEAVAETDEKLMEKYFNGEEFTLDEIKSGLRKGAISGDLVPVIVGSALENIGVHTLLKMIFEYMPTPTELQNGERIGVTPESEKEEKRKVSVDEPFSAIVFKTFVDPFIGKVTLFKVNSGVLKKDTEVLNANKGKKERISLITYIRGNKQEEAKELVAGDIGATTKLQFTQTGDTLCDKDHPIMFKPIEFPEACFYSAVKPAEKADDDKLSTCLSKMLEEDPTFKVSRNYETKQLLVGGQGEKHLFIILCKIKNKFGVHGELQDQIVSYRETIKNTVEVQGKHKKQSGGAGQYGDVHIRFEPSKEEFVFVDDVHGGAIPKSYIPAVEKGLIEAKEHGVLAGYPVINFKATLFDGTFHSVDSNEISFKLAAILAFKLGMPKADPVLLEPISKMEIIIPEQYLGDVMGDMNKRRARILGMEHNHYGEQVLSVEVPQSEILKYALDLRAMTQGRGSFTYKFEKYDVVPEVLAKKIIASRAEAKESK